MKLRLDRSTSSLALTLCVSISGCVIACPAVLADGDAAGGANLKGKVSTPDSSWADIKTGEELPLPSVRDLQLWVKMSAGKSGISQDIKPILGAKTRKMTDAEREQFWADVNDNADVQKRIDQWKAWYGNIFDVVRQQVPNFPQEVRFGISVTVNKDKTISPSVDFADKTPHFDCIVFADKICHALKQLNGKDSLAFPGKSDPEMVKFTVQTGGFENIELFSASTNLGL